MGHLAATWVWVVAMVLAGCAGTPGAGGAGAPPDAAPAAYPRDEPRALGAEVDGASLEAWSYGGHASAPALVVLGDAGLSHELYLELATLAGPGLRVVLFDPRAVDGGPEGVDGRVLEGALAEVEALREALGATSLRLLGHGHGALVALEFALALPASVDALVLLDPQPPGAAHRAAHLMALERRRERLRAIGVLPAALPPVRDGDCSARWQASVPQWLGDPTQGLARTMVWPRCREDVATQLVADLRAAEGDEPLLRLAAVAVPTLVVWGERAPGGAAAATALHEALGRSVVRAAELEGCGALPWLECREALLPVLDVFLALHAD